MDFINKLNQAVVYIGDDISLYKSHIKNISVLSNISRSTIINIVNNKKVYFIIQSDKADTICPLLESLGLRYKEHYVDDLIINKLIFKDKKLAVMYGNCQMHDYFDCVNKSEPFKTAYNSIYFKYQEYPRWREDRLETFLCFCDLFIFTHERFDLRFRNCELFMKENNNAARLIKIPTYSYRGYFPQTNPFIQEKGEFDIINEFFNSFHREDKKVNELINESYSTDEIIENVMSGKTFTKEEIIKCNEISLKQIEAMDRVSDVKIFDYFVATYKNQRLFKDPVHMENNLTWYISLKILELLNIPIIKNVPTEEIHYFTELPIYPEVSDTLNLKWCTSAQKIKIRLQEGMIEASVEEFLRRYIKFAKNACEIRRSLTISDFDVVSEWFNDYGH